MSAPLCKNCGEPNDRPESDICEPCWHLALTGHGWKRGRTMHNTRGPDDGDPGALDELKQRRERRDAPESPMAKMDRIALERGIDSASDWIDLAMELDEDEGVSS